MQLTVVSRATLHILARGPDLASGAVDGRVKVCIEVMRESDTSAVTLRTSVLPSGIWGSEAEPAHGGQALRVRAFPSWS